MEPKITYLYNPVEGRLTILKDGKPKGGFIGDIAQRKFCELLETGVEINFCGSNMTKKDKIRQLRALWIKQGIDQFRESILEPYGVISTADLTEAQLDELIEKYKYDRHFDTPHDVRAARSVVLKLLTELGVYDNKSDWTRVNEFLQNRRIAGKLLYQMDVREMKDLSMKLRAMIVKKHQEN